MAQSPQFKVYRGKEYVAACKFADDAAVLVAASSGGTIRYGHSLIVWTEGSEEFPAGESYDRAAEVMHTRIRAAHTKNLLRLGWTQEKIEEFFERQ